MGRRDQEGREKLGRVDKDQGKRKGVKTKIRGGKKEEEKERKRELKTVTSLMRGKPILGF